MELIVLPFSKYSFLISCTWVIVSISFNVLLVFDVVIKVQGNIIAGAFNGLSCIIEEFYSAILGNFPCNNVLFYSAINKKN